MGFNLAAHYKDRPRQIRQLMNGVTALKSYVHYASMPLAEAFCHSAAGVSDPVSGLFAAIGELLHQQGWLTPREAIAQALNRNEAQLALKKAEQEALILFGANLGMMNREEQQRYCDMLLAQLEKIEQDALILRDQNATMYRYLGVCGGMTIAILLL